MPEWQSRWMHRCPPNLPKPPSPVPTYVSPIPDAADWTVNVIAEVPPCVLYWVYEVATVPELAVEVPPSVRYRIWPGTTQRISRWVWVRHNVLHGTSPGRVEGDGAISVGSIILQGVGRQFVNSIIVKC
jgi:hypothetical protein